MGKPSGFVRSKTDDTFTEEGGRSKIRKRVATANSKSGLGDGRRTNFSRRGASKKDGKRGIEYGSQKERFGVRKPFRASKSNNKNSSGR